MSDRALGKNIGNELQFVPRGVGWVGRSRDASATHLLLQIPNRWRFSIFLAGLTKVSSIVSIDLRKYGQSSNRIPSVRLLE